MFLPSTETRARLTSATNFVCASNTSRPDHRYHLIIASLETDGRGRGHCRRSAEHPQHHTHTHTHTHTHKLDPKNMKSKIFIFISHFLYVVTKKTFLFILHFISIFRNSFSFPISLRCKKEKKKNSKKLEMKFSKIPSSFSVSDGKWNGLTTGQCSGAQLYHACESVRTSNSCPNYIQKEINM